MEVIIHGSIGGAARVVYKTQNVPSSIVKDLRRGNNEYALGQTAYSIEFASDGCAFSICVIVRDIERRAVGYVAFSVFYPSYKNLSGTDTKNLLDQLKDKYFLNNNITYNNFGIGKNDCDFIDELTGPYDEILQSIMPDDVRPMQHGTAEAAFVYYSTNEELQGYFDDPYQEEYSPYRQVFFVKDELNGKPQNPLNALRHDPLSNLTGKINLKNPEYTLSFNKSTDDGVQVQVQVNGKKLNNGSKIRKKNQLEIIYTKPCYEEQQATGKWDTIDDKFVEVDDFKQTVTIRKVELLPEPKTITFEVKDRKYKPVSDAEITVSKGDESRKAINNKITFFGEERKDKWKVLGKKDNFLGKSEFTPENVIAPVALVLIKTKMVTFDVVDDEDKHPVNDYIIWVGNQSTKPGETNIEFFGNEINETLNINILHPNYETKTFRYCPAKDDNPKYVQLRKRQSSDVVNTLGNTLKDKKYYLKVDEARGERTYNGTPIKEFVYYSERNNYRVKCDAKPGYKFINWKKNEIPFADYAGYYEAQFKELLGHKIRRLRWILLGGIALLIVTMLFIVIHRSDNNELPNIADKIDHYVTGTELKKDSLEYYSEKCQEIGSIQSTREEGFWQKIFGAKKKNKSDNTINCQEIDSALAIRKAINQGKIGELKHKEYSDEQSQFKYAIDSIDAKYEQKIGEVMKSYTVSMNLNDVATFITNLQTILRIDVKTLHSDTDCNIKIKQIDSLQLDDIPIVKSIKGQIKIISKRDSLKELAQRSNEHNGGTPASDRPVTQPHVRKPHPPVRDKPAASTALETDFWNLVHSGNDQKDPYTQLLSRYKNKDLKGEEKDIVTLLKKICKNSVAFDKFKKKLEGQDAIDINTLTQIDTN